MTKRDPNDELAKVNSAIARQHKRWRMISNKLTKFYKQKTKLEKKIAKSEAAQATDVINAGFVPPHGQSLPQPVDNGDSLDIRNQGWVSSTGQVTPAAEAELAALKTDEAAKAAIEAELTEHRQVKTKGQAAKRKATKSGARKTMPLQGRAALSYIRDGKA